VDGLVELALGTAQWGMPYGIANRAGQPSMSEIERMLTAARAAGVRTLDTAPAYGSAEEVIGSLAGEDPYWTVMTKLSPDLDGAASARASLALSRQAVRRSRLDVVVLHRAEHRRAYAGAVWEVVMAERAAGGIDRVGISAHGPGEATEALADPDVEVVQVAASLLDQRLARAGFFAKAAEVGKHVIVRSVFLQGVAHLPVEELPPRLAGLAEPLGAIDSWAAGHGVDRAAAFLGYASSLGAQHVLVGCEAIGQLEENLRWWSNALPPAQAREVAELVPALPTQLIDPATW